jgi:hypothetical protein
MNKNILIGVVVVILVIIGVVLYVPKTDNSISSTDVLVDSATTTVTQTTSSGTVVKGASTNTFKSIFSQPGSHVCAFEQVSQASRTSGNVYIADGKMRAEFRTTIGEKKISNMMVYNGGTLYVWVEGTAVGTKSQLKSVSELPFVIPQDLTSGSVLGSGLNSASWDCHDWSKNNTLLAPPTTVKFY